MIGSAPSAPPALRFTADGVEAYRAAAVPTLRLRLRAHAQGAPVRGLGLNVDVRIAAERRRYGNAETERLRELFGVPPDWSRSLGAVPWLQTSLNVPGFDGDEGTVDVLLPCTFDFEVVSAKYLAALDDGEIPLDVLFTGNLFYANAEGRLQTAKIPWNTELSVRVPVAVWRDAVDATFPNAAWLRMDRDVLRRLHAYRSRSGFAGWDETLTALLDGMER